jgi:chemotaxis protein CheZ
MSQADSLSARYRSHVADMVGALDANDETAFRGAFERVRLELNVEFNPELKRIAASAQEALRKFREEARIDALATHEVPDARKRLTHVVKLTSDAAHRTLDLIEQSSPLVDHWARDASQLLEEWANRGSRELVAASLWPERTNEFLERTLTDAARVRSCLTQMLLAQSYQDLTGQIIRSVTDLVGELEAVLGQLVTLANGDDTRRMPVLRPLTIGHEAQRGVGPHVPGIDDAGAVSGQSDIDELLASVAGGK